MVDRRTGTGVQPDDSNLATAHAHSPLAPSRTLTTCSPTRTVAASAANAVIRA